MIKKMTTLTDTGRTDNDNAGIDCYLQRQRQSYTHIHTDLCVMHTFVSARSFLAVIANANGL